MPNFGKLFSEREVIGGFISSVLISGGLLHMAALGGLWILAAPIVIVLGIALLIDDVVPYGREPAMGTELGSILAGSVASVLAFGFGIGWDLLAAGLLLAVMKLFLKLRKTKGTA